MLSICSRADWPLVAIFGGASIPTLRPILNLVMCPFTNELQELHLFLVILSSACCHFLQIAAVAGNAENLPCGSLWSVG